jgi:hypothetical protein
MQSTIRLHDDTKGWHGTFANVPGMPDATLPLPFGEQAPAAMVVGAMVKRFPHIDVLYIDRIALRHRMVTGLACSLRDAL